MTATAASMVQPGPRFTHLSTDRGASREAHVVWMAILAVERSAWDTEQSHVRRQRDLALAEAFHECSQPD